MKRVVLAGLMGLLATAAILAQAPSTGSKPTPKPAVKAKPVTKAKPAVKAVAEKGPTETVAVLQTKLGKIVIKFFPDKAPNHVKNFISLCKSGFYNGTKFHRVVPGFMIQGGDPNTKKSDVTLWGQGGHEVNGKEVTVKAEFNDIHHARGIVSMARAQDPNSASSQFFICVGDAGFLDGKYTAFGQVIEGMDVVDKIVSGPTVKGPDDPEGSRPQNPVAIEKAFVEQIPVPQPTAQPAAPAPVK